MKLSKRTTDISLPGFILTATGMVSKGKPTFDQWKEVGQFLERAEGAVQWWIGDWLNYGEGRPQWGDKYEQAIAAFNREYKTLAEYKAVAERIKFPARAGNLSWTHHRAVAYEPPEVRESLLEQAKPDEAGQRPRMSVSELKKEAKRIRRESGTPPLPEGTYRVLYADPPWPRSPRSTRPRMSGTRPRLSGGTPRASVNRWNFRTRVLRSSCVLSDRRCIVIEQNEEYCEIAARRIEEIPTDDVQQAA